MLNIWAAVGRVAKKDTRTTATGTMYIKFMLAVPREKDKSGNVQTDFIPCAIVGNSGKFFDSYCEVGALVSVSGPMQSSPYEKNGVKVTAYECFVTKYNLLSPAGAKTTQPAPAQQQPQPQYYQQAPAPMPPAPPAVIGDMIPPDPYEGTLPFSIY